MRNQTQRQALFASLVSDKDTVITVGVLATRAANGLADVISTVAATVGDDITVFGAACIRTQLDINKAKRAAALRLELSQLEG